MRNFVKRKRSHVAGLTLLGLTGLTTGCDPGPTEAELSAQQFGAPQDVQLFQSVYECIAQSGLTEQQCRQAEAQAFKEGEKYAPRFDSMALCEEQFGVDNCTQQGTQSGGSGFFTPLLAGFLIGQALDFDRPSFRYTPVYRNKRDGVYYTGSGAWLYSYDGAKGANHFRVGSKGLQTPIAAPRVQTRASVVSRGGFGGKARASEERSSRASGYKSGGWGRGG